MPNFRNPLVGLAGLAVLAAACSTPAISSEAAGVSPAVAAELTELRSFERDPIAYESAFAESIAVCMQRQGYDYTAFTEGDYVPDQRTEAERVAEDGFGMVTAIEGINDDLTPTDDPNDETRSALAPDQQAAWDAALSGCSAAAVDEVPPLDPDISPEAAAVMADARAAAEGSETYAEAQAAWRTCMANAGHEYERREAMLSELGALADRFAMPFVDAVNELTQAGKHEEAVDLEVRDVLSGQDLADYGAAVALELELAASDLDCAAGLAEAYEEALDRAIGGEGS